MKDSKFGLKTCLFEFICLLLCFKINNMRKTIIIELSENEFVINGIVTGNVENSTFVILNPSSDNKFEEILEYLRNLEL